MSAAVREKPFPTLPILRPTDRLLWPALAVGAASFFLPLASFCGLFSPTLPPSEHFRIRGEARNGRVESWRLGEKFSFPQVGKYHSSQGKEGGGGGAGSDD